MKVFPNSIILAEALPLSVIPAKAGISSQFMFKSILQIIIQYCNQIPAFAGMTEVEKIHMAEIKPIRTSKDHERAMKEVETLWGAKSGTPKGDRLDVLATLIDAWEAAHYPMAPPVDRKNAEDGDN